jgi:MATE family multidrug resistance protein
MGLAGAGLATFLTRVLMTVGIHLIVYYSSFRKYIDIRLRWDVTTIRKIMSIGVPAGFQYVFETAAFATAAILMGMLGTNELAAHQIAINLASIPFMVCIGLSAAASIRMGNAFGNHDWQKIRASGQNILGITLVFMVVSCGLLVLFRNWLPTLYIKDVEVISIAAHMLLIAAIFQLSDGLQAVGVGLLRGVEDVKWPTFYTLFAYWIIAIPLGSLLGFYFEMGYIGIWIGLLMGLTISAILLVSRFYNISRSKLDV